MDRMLVNFAAEAPAADTGLFGALGINWQLLIIQLIGFLVLVGLLGKFVYPWLMKQVDERQANIEKAAKAAVAAQKAAAQSEEDVAEALEKARQEAADIVETARLEAAEVLAIAEKKAAATAERITADAKAQIDKDLAKAKEALRDETLELIVLATEKIAGADVSAKLDDARVAKVLKEVS